MSVLSNICPEFVIFTELIWTEKHKYMVNVSRIEKVEWLFETGLYKDCTNEIIRQNYNTEVN